MLTTIGYGNLAPATPLGRVVCCIYGLLGIPLLLVTTANCGSFISDCLRMLHRKLHPRIDQQGAALPGITEPDEANNLIDKLSEASETESEADDEPDEPVPASWVLAILLIYVLLGTFLLPLFEPWSYFESLYFSLITITTIGYGDYVPLNRDYYFLTLTYILLGLALVTMSMELVAGQYIKKVHFFGRKIVLAKEALRNAKQLMKCMSLFGVGGARQLQRGVPIGFRTTRALSLAPELYIFHRLLVRSRAYTPADIDRILFIDQSIWDPYKNVAAQEEDGHSSMIYMDDLAGVVITDDLHEMKSEMDFPLMEQRIILSKAKRRAKSWDNRKMWAGILYTDCRRNTL
uniref:Potassium channel domain-containing protein n=1 Tax=Romanomermis culicivorax TaxID=13658 RepID=A0A915HPP2_ROMCU